LNFRIRDRVRKTIMRDVKQLLAASDSEPPGLSRRVRTAGINPAARLGFALFALIALVASLRAAPPAVSDKTNADPQAAAADTPVLPPDEAAQIGAASLFLNGFPTGSESFSELILLSAGEQTRFWTFFDPDIVRSIPAPMLARVQDNTGMTQEIADPEQDAYFLMLIFANRTSPEALDKAGRENEKREPPADWVHIVRNPADYRGEIVHFEGTLKRLREFPPQPMAAQGGVRKYYEGFMYADVLEGDPVFFDITELPKGLKPGDHLNVKIGLSGYFFKKFRYTAVDTKKTNKDRLAPLVIGHTVTLLTEPAAAEPPPDSEWVNWLGPMFFGGIGLTLAILFAVGYWFRRGDWRVRGRVIAARHADFIEPPPESPPTREGGAAAPHNRLSQGQRDFPTSDN
jgi:hypothetical protein